MTTNAMSHARTNPEIQNTRTAYREGGVLSAAALIQDSQNRVDMLAQHQRVAHTPGIVAGLMVTKLKDSAEITVGPGAAIDHEGRLLLVRETISVPIVTGQTIAVWLRPKATTSTAVIPAHSEFLRDREEVQVELSEMRDREPDEAAEDQTGILLAVLNDGGQEINHGCRRYAGAVGQRIDSPSGWTQIVLGPQSPQDSRRFAVGVRPSPELPHVDVLKWESTGTITLSAPTRIGTPPMPPPMPPSMPSTDVITPPLVSIGAPSVKVTPDDILDLCQIRRWLKNPVNNTTTMTAESITTTDRVVECLNRMIRKVDDDDFDTAYLPPETKPIKRPTAYDERKRIDMALPGALRPLSHAAPRGLSFRGAGPAEPERQPYTIRLVEGVKEGKPFRQLRISIQNPGKDNSPYRYRCSLGQANCQDPLVPVDKDQMIWNRQTGSQRGILSVLADGSVDIHNSLSVLPRPDSLTPGLILKLEPPGGALSGIPVAATTPVLATAILWDNPVMQRDAATTGTGTMLVLSGSLRNTTDQPIDGVSASAVVFAKDNTTLPLTTLPLEIGKQIPARESIDSDQSLRIPAEFNGLPIVVTFMIHGALRNNSLAQSIYRRELPP